MEFPDLIDYFGHLACELQSPIDFRVFLMPDRILVVDDEEPIREIVASMLGTAGYACKQAASGLEALAILTSGEEFELMLSHWAAGADQGKVS
jgi:DNA-binding NtrC family response regulator